MSMFFIFVMVLFSLLFVCCILCVPLTFLVQAFVAAATEDHRLGVSFRILAVWFRFLAVLSLQCLGHLTVAI